MSSSSSSLSSLQELAQQLVEQSSSSSSSKTDKDHQHNINQSNSPLVCLVVAGGGGHAISTLASTPGASSLFLEGTVTYDQNAFHSYTNLPSRSSSSSSNNHDDGGFRYVSSEAAHLLSQAALRRALTYRPSLADQLRCVGIGCTSSLVSTVSRPRPGRTSRGHIVASRADGTQWECRISLASSSSSNDGEIKKTTRTRFEEDLLMSQLILTSIQQLDRSGSCGRDETESSMMTTTTLSQIVQEDDDVECWFREIVSQRPQQEPQQQQDAVKMAAHRILSGEESAVLLLPNKKDAFVALERSVIPQGSLLFPGSFNPPHEGHVALAKAAVRKWSQQEHQQQSSPAILMELSLTNPDKPSMDPETVSHRVHQFLRLENDMPEDWGILLTSAPLFAEKAEVFRERVVTVRNEGPRFAFVIGTDTMVRILNPKYYGNSYESMLEAISTMREQGVHFVVGGRLENGKKESGKFVTGEEELSSLPSDLQDMFTLFKEDEFRLDISSTEIRKRKSLES